MPLALLPHSAAPRHHENMAGRLTVLSVLRGGKASLLRRQYDSRYVLPAVIVSILHLRFMWTMSA